MSVFGRVGGCFGFGLRVFFRIVESRCLDFF